jgi:hypothetical protein
MYRLAEEVAKKLLRNIKNPELGPFDSNQTNPFEPKSTRSVGMIDCYAAIGTNFDYILEMSFPFINAALPPLPVLSGYWLYKKGELMPPNEAFNVPRYLVDPNTENGDDVLDVSDCSIVLPSDVDKLSATSILTFERLIEIEPLILDCLVKDLK